MQQHVLVGTFHKTGTIWMRDVFIHICKILKLRFYHLVGPGAEDPRIGWARSADLIGVFEKTRANVESRNRHGVFFEWHSHFPPRQLLAGCRGIVVIRDPRDVLISSAHYHPKADEPWLHVPDKKFAGMTYAEKINSYENFDDRIKFEMENVGGTTIRSMDRFECGDVFEIVRYETLIGDTTLIAWHDLLIWLGFEDLELIVGQEALWLGAIFGGQRDSKSEHIRNGAARQWQTTFSTRVLQEVEAEFGPEIQSLGYDLSDTT